MSILDLNLKTSSMVKVVKVVSPDDMHSENIWSTWSKPGMCGAAFYSAGGAKVKNPGAGRGEGENPRGGGGAGRESTQINQFKNFTKRVG